MSDKVSQSIISSRKQTYSCAMTRKLSRGCAADAG
jgi:hypothetical protein